MRNSKQHHPGEYPEEFMGAKATRNPSSSRGIGKGDAEHKNSITLENTRKNLWERKRPEILPVPGVLERVMRNSN